MQDTHGLHSTHRLALSKTQPHRRVCITLTEASGLLASSLAMMVALLSSPSFSRMWGVLHDER